MNEEGTGYVYDERDISVVRSHRYCVAVNQVMVATVKPSK